MKSIRLQIAGALGLAFLPLPWEMFHLVMTPVHAQAPAQAPPPGWSHKRLIRLPLQMSEQTRANLTEIKLYVKAAGRGLGPGPDGHGHARAL